MKIGFTCGSYDLLHCGHILAFKESKEQCDFLIVGLQSDPTIDRPDTKNKPVQSIVERIIQLEGCKYVDSIWLYNTEEELTNYLKENPMEIDIRFLGADWKDKEFTGKGLIKEEIFTSRTHNYSSSNLRKRIVQDSIK